MKKTIHAFELGSLFLLLLGLFFPAITIYGLISAIITGSFTTTHVLIISVGAALTYCISVSCLKIVFMTKFVFYDTYVEIVWFDTIMNYFSSDIKSFFIPIAPKRDIVKYNEISKYGSFEGHQLRRNGRDENNNIVIKASSDKKTYNFIIPKQFEMSRNYFIINDINDKSWLIDGKLYSRRQVKRILDELSVRSKKKPKGKLSSAPPLLLIIFILVGMIFPLFIAKLEGWINPLHAQPYDSNLQTFYTISWYAFLVLTFFGVFSFSKDDDEPRDQEQIKSSLLLFLLAAVALTITIAIFITSVNKK